MMLPFRQPPDACAIIADDMMMPLRLMLPRCR